MPEDGPEPDALEEGDWPKPSVAVDVVALTVQGHKLEVLVHRRRRSPAKGELALPGVFLVDEAEAPEAAMGRALIDKAQLSAHAPPQLVSVENHPHEERKEPRGWVITVVFLTVVPWWELVEPTAEGSGVRLLEVVVPRDFRGEPVGVQTLAGGEVQLAFDHQTLIGKALAWLRDQIWRSDFCLELVHETFTLRQLQDVYEAILGTELYRTSFRRRVAEGQHRVVDPTGDVLDTDPRKPELFRRVPR